LRGELFDEGDECQGSRNDTNLPNAREGGWKDSRRDSERDEILGGSESKPNPILRDEGV
jgi:hypothetical protein